MFELSLVFYNGFLPEIADDDQFNQVSAWGYGLGYLGGGLALASVLLLMKFGPQLGLSDVTSQLRVGICIMGVWWGLFTLPTLFILKDLREPTTVHHTIKQSLLEALAEVVSTLRNIRTFSTLFLFLLAFLLYNDGVQTVISQSSSFALQELRFTEAELAGVILMIQFLACREHWSPHLPLIVSDQSQHYWFAC
jgi:UMF1 family MFS transporter